MNNQPATQLVLASQSPRRRALLRQAGISFTVEEPQFDERALVADLMTGRVTEERAEKICRRLARAKVETIQRENDERLILGADTLVVWDGCVLDKPKNPEEARAMLLRLLGQTHQVYSGFCLRQGRRSREEVVRTDVRFVAASPVILQAVSDYVASGSPLDKAGAYGIQDFAAIFVEGIDGDYNSVVGLPLARVWRALQEWPQIVS